MQEAFGVFLHGVWAGEIWGFVVLYQGKPVFFSPSYHNILLVFQYGTSHSCQSHIGRDPRDLLLQLPETAETNRSIWRLLLDLLRLGGPHPMTIHCPLASTRPPPVKDAN